MSSNNDAVQSPGPGSSQYTIHTKVDIGTLRKELLETVQQTADTFRLAWLSLGEVADALNQTESTPATSRSSTLLWNPFDNLYTGEIKHPFRYIGEGHPGPCSAGTNKETGSGCSVPTSPIPFLIRARLTSDGELRVDKTEEERTNLLGLRTRCGDDEVALLGTAAVSAVVGQADEGLELSPVSTGVQYPLGNVPIAVTGSSLLEGETEEQTMHGHVPLVFTIALC